jgi:hypothetical protein
MHHDLILTGLGTSPTKTADKTAIPAPLYLLTHADSFISFANKTFSFCYSFCPL